MRGKGKWWPRVRRCWGAPGTVAWAATGAGGRGQGAGAELVSLVLEDRGMACEVAAGAQDGFSFKLRDGGYAENAPHADCRERTSVRLFLFCLQRPMRTLTPGYSR